MLSIHYTIMGGIVQKGPCNGLSRWHTKRRMGAHGRAHPSFGMTPTFQNLTLLTL